MPFRLPTTLLLGALAVGCSVFSPRVPKPDLSASRYRATCSDIEQEPCVAESVTLSSRDLGLSEAEYRAFDRRSMPVRCVLRETGVVEACHVLESHGSPLDGAVEQVLQRRRYEPVTYQERKVLVPYTFLVSFAAPPGEASATSAIRLEVFRALLHRLSLSASASDAGLPPAQPLACVGIGEDVADPPRAELEALARGGANVQPASGCWGLLQVTGGAAPFASVVVREVRFERPDVASVRSEVGISGQTPEVVLLRASRLGTRWLIEERARTPLSD